MGAQYSVNVIYIRMTPTEAEITKSLRPEVAPEQKVEVDQAELAGYGKDYEHTRLYDQFGINPSDRNPRVEEALGKIWDWAKKSSVGKDNDSVLYHIISLKNRLGSPAIGEPSYLKVLNYINVSNQMGELGSRLSEMERGNG